jgi:hypothetical protein
MSTSWRDILPVHPAADLFPMMTPDEITAFGEDIKNNGLKQPIVLIRTPGGDALLDGEVVATARALGRVLAGAGADWLAAVLVGPAKGVQLAPPSWAAMSRPQRLDSLDRLLAAECLSGWERAFVDRIRAGTHLWPRSGQSAKQRAMLIGEVV